MASKQFAYDAAYRLKNKDKIKARSAVNYQIRIGKLTPPNTCTICSQKCKLESHHEDYSKPLDIVWLCKECHTDAHRKRA